MITSFQGEYRFLSNFYPVNIEYEGIIYPSVEHAYVAAKTLDQDARRSISLLKTAGEAKKVGKNIELRSDWDHVKLHIMILLLEKKFSNRELLEKLRSTWPHDLIEGNTWGDTFWGQCPIGTGRNELGKLLMSIRDDVSTKWDMEE